MGLVARPGMGQLVLLAELFFRLRKQGYITMMLKPEEETNDIQDAVTYVDVLTESIDQTYEKIMELGSDQNVIFATDRSHVLSGNVLDIQEKLSNLGYSNVTTLLLDLKGEVVDEDLPYGPLETLWQFDADLAARNKFPAVNPIYSTSSVLEGIHIDQNHFMIQQRAQKLLRRYRELSAFTKVRGIDKLPESELIIFKRGERLEAYLTQPFFVAEDFSGIKGKEVSLQETLEDIRKILDGSVDAKKTDALNYIGKL